MIAKLGWTIKFTLKLPLFILTSLCLSVAPSVAQSVSLSIAQFVAPSAALFVAPTAAPFVASGVREETYGVYAYVPVVGLKMCRTKICKKNL